jgi:hypothetical protein
MKFSVLELKYLSELVRSFDRREGKSLSTMLHKRQPDFCEIIDEVGMDPRCVRAHGFCTSFCAMAFKYAEEDARSRLPRYLGVEIFEVAGFITRGEEKQIGRRACGYRNRILRHVLMHDEFDEEDTGWLCTTIASFLFIVETHFGEKGKNGSPNPYKAFLYQGITVSH